MTLSSTSTTIISHHLHQSKPLSSARQDDIGDEASGLSDISVRIVQRRVGTLVALIDSGDGHVFPRKWVEYTPQLYREDTCI